MHGNIPVALVVRNYEDDIRLSVSGLQGPGRAAEEEKGQQRCEVLYMVVHGEFTCFLVGALGFER